MLYVILLIFAIVGLLGSLFLLYCCLLVGKMVDEEMDGQEKDNWKISDRY